MSCPLHPASMAAVGRRRQIAALRERQKRLIRQTYASDKPRNSEDHAAGAAIASELEAIQAEIDQLTTEQEQAHEQK